MKIHFKVDFSLTFVGILTWIVFAILQWGTRTIGWANTATFWFWFPLWIGAALDAAWFLLVWILAIVISAI